METALIKEIIEYAYEVNIACSPSGYKASVINIPKKCCKICGQVVKYQKNIVGLGKTPKIALDNLLKEIILWKQLKS
jgi:hypothetical protein